MMSKYTNPGNQKQDSEDKIRVNGFGQVLEMLKIADPEFRESLLRRLATKDRNLALQLRQDLINLGLL